MYLLLPTFLVLSLLWQGTTAATAVADDNFLVEVTVNLGRGKKGSFVMEVHPAWAPLGAERMRDIVNEDVSLLTMYTLDQIMWSRCIRTHIQLLISHDLNQS